MPGMTKQELKHDELEDVFDRLGLWYQRHARWIQWVVIVALVAFVGTKLYDRYSETQAARRTAELGKLQTTLVGALLEKDANKRKELFATAIADAERLSKEWGASFHGRQALLLLANAHYYYSLALANDKTEAATERKQARAAFERFIAGASTAEEKATGYLGLGNVLENDLFATRDLALLKEAENAYNEAAKLAPNTYIEAEARLALARMYQPVSDKRSEAERALARVVESRKPFLDSWQSKNTDSETKKKARASASQIDQEKLRQLQTFSALSYVQEARRLQLSLAGFEPAKAK